MSTKSTELTKEQKMIIDALADDYENIKEIASAFAPSFSKKQIKDALWCLVEQGLVTCFHAEKTGMKPVSKPEAHQLNKYWFNLSEAGELTLDTLRY